MCGEKRRGKLFSSGALKTDSQQKLPVSAERFDAMTPALTTETSLPLSRYSLFDSHDLDETREFVGRIFCPHRLSTLRPGSQLDARHHSVPVHRDVSLNYVQYGAGVGIEPGYLRDFYLLQIPLRGGATVRCGGQLVESHAAVASFPSPSQPLSMRWHEGSPQIIVKLGRAAIHERLESLLQATASKPLVFDLAVDLQAPALIGVASFIAYLRAGLDNNPFFLAHSLLAEQAENHLLTSILLSMRHNYSNQLAIAGEAQKNAHPARGTVLPRAVKRAQDFMHSQVDKAITLADVCAHVGTSARSLQQCFQHYTGISPMVFLRDLRLDCVHAELMNAELAPKVSDVAARFGFLHLGHFASHYRQRFGEIPSQTRSGRV
jgi:AraC-like DNA-binding protein